MAVTLTTQQLEVLAEWLHGTSASTPNLGAPLGTQYEDVELEDLTTETQIALHFLVDRCADCGWWTSVDELADIDDEDKDEDFDEDAEHLICDGCRMGSY